jgi:hypothetical protein
MRKDSQDCWIHWNEELYGKTEEEQLAKMMKEVDDKIRVQYEKQRSRESMFGG